MIREWHDAASGISATPSRCIAWLRGTSKAPMCNAFYHKLATYLGHLHIAATQRYLTMTPELLREASQRFERYVREGHHE